MNKRSAVRSTPLGKKLRLIRDSLGLSQSEILEHLGFSDALFRSNISQYERGARVPSPKVLLAYSRLARIDLEALIDDEMALPEKFPGTRRKVSS